MGHHHGLVVGGVDEDAGVVGGDGVEGRDVVAGDGGCDGTVGC